MNAGLARWLPAGMLATGALFTVGIDAQRALPLAASLQSTIPDTLAGYWSHDLTLAPGEVKVAAPTQYLLREYSARDSAGQRRWFSLYIGYYDTQAQGKTIHSPKNCLPGAGWVALSAQVTTITTARGPVTANRYLIEHKTPEGVRRAVVFYWYQGRGRVEADEYVVKWNLLRDAAVRHRSDEALARIVVPVTTDPEAASRAAERVASVVIPALWNALPS